MTFVHIHIERLAIHFEKCFNDDLQVHDWQSGIILLFLVAVDLPGMQGCSRDYRVYRKNGKDMETTIQGLL